MDKNKFRYCTLLLINDQNHSKIFISKKNKYYIRDDNELIRIKILNEFKDIRKSYKTNVKDITDDYYKTDEPHIIRHCTILLIDDDNLKFLIILIISEKNLYYISCDGYKNYDYDDDNDNYDNFDDEYDDYDDYDDDDDDDFIIDYDEEVAYYNKPLKDFKRLVYVENNSIVNLINNNNYRNNIKLLVDDFYIFISGNNNQIDGNGILLNYKLSIHKAKIYDHSTYTLIIIKKFLLFFFTVYKNERKENKF